jgi:crotonobetainyl-CoA:carnitine CoA-transferase CaiB-like acyl-CoA transferase
MTAPLEGVRVLDLTRHIPGPYATQLLAALGADVVKVEEPPGGDPTRAVPPAVGDESAIHAALNRHKRSVVVDLRAPEGAAVVRRLAEGADVLVEGFRPGVLGRRGLGAPELLSANPRLVYCSLTGYGRDSARSSRAVHDIDFLALSGFLAGNRDVEGLPVLPVTQVGDVTGGLFAVIAILGALQARARTGRGQHVEVSLLDSALALMTVPATRRLAGGAADDLTGRYACYGVYQCRDGRSVAVGALEPKFWEGLCKALGLPELIGRQWDRGARGLEVRRILEHAFAARDRADWVRELGPADVCVEPVLDVEEAAGPASAREMSVTIPVAGGIARSLGFPMRFETTPLRGAGGPPGLGAHTEAVLAEAGLAADEVARLRGQGIVA